MTLMIRLNRACLEAICDLCVREIPQRIEICKDTSGLLTVCLEEFESNVLVARQEKVCFVDQHKP